MSTDVQQMDLQGALNAVASQDSPHRFIRSVTFGEAQHYLQSDPLHVRYPARVDMNGSRVTATHAHHGVVIGEDAKVYELDLHHGGVEYHLPNAMSPGSGFRVKRCDRSIFTELQAGRFEIGFDFTPFDEHAVHDITIQNIRAAGCRRGLVVDNVNVLKVFGLDAHGELDGHTVSDSIGMHLRKVVSGVVFGAKIQATERAFFIDDCTGISIQGLYTEQHGGGVPRNNTAVGEIHNSRNVCVHGLVNATNGSSSDPTHCKTGLRISGDCKAIVIDTRFFNCREFEVELRDTDPEEVTIIGKGGATVNPEFSPRVFRGASLTKEEIAVGVLSEAEIKPSASINPIGDGQYEFGVNRHEHQLPLQGFVDTPVHGLRPGDELEAEVDVRMTSQNPVGSSGQAVFRLTLGTPEFYASKDLPMSLTGDSDTLSVRWTVPEEVPSQLRFSLGSRPTNGASPRFDLFVTQVSDVRIYRR